MQIAGSGSIKMLHKGNVDFYIQCQTLEQKHYCIFYYTIERPTKVIIFTRKNLQVLLTVVQILVYLYGKEEIISYRVL